MLLLAACPKPKPVYKPVVVPDPVGDVKKRIAALYAVLEVQEPDRLEDLLTPDITAYGLAPKDTFITRDDVQQAVRSELIPIGLRGDVFKVVSSHPNVGLAVGERSAWFYDFPRFEQARPDHAPRRWMVRVTGHLVKEDAWRFDAVHVSFGFPDAELYAPDALKKLKPPSSPGVDQTGAEEVIGLTKQMLDDIAIKVERTSDAPTAVLIGTDPADLYEGGAHFKELARPKLPELKKAAFTLKIEDGPRAKVAADGRTAYVAGNVVLRLGSGKKMQTLPTFRALWLFHAENEQWALISEHQSLGLLPNQRTQVGDEDESVDAGAR